MQIPSFFWSKFRRLCATRLVNEDHLQSQIDGIFTAIATCSRSDRDRRMAALFSTLGRLPNAVERGFHIGTQIPATAYGTASLGMLTAPTIGATLQFIADIRRTTFPLLVFGYDASASEGHFTIGFRCPIDREAEALVVALCIAAIESELARRSGRIGNFARLELTPSSRGTETSYRNWLGRVPGTSASVNTLVFTRAVLDLPNTYADSEIFDGIRLIAK